MIDDEFHTGSEILKIRGFIPGDQTKVKALILSGLEEHFGFIEPAYNPDLNNIWQSYIEQGAVFLIIDSSTGIVGTGAVIREDEETGRIVRLSVKREYRRLGIGRFITCQLLQVGRKLGYKRIVVETNDDWQTAINLYKQCGFRPYDHVNGEIHMQLYFD